MLLIKKIKKNIFVDIVCIIAMTRCSSCGCQSKEFIDQCIITEIIGTQGRIKFPVKVFVKNKKKHYHRRRGGGDDVDSVKIKKQKPKSEIHVIFYTWMCRVKHPKRNKPYYIIIIRAGRV